MARYANGKIPSRELVKLGTEHYATPATAQRLRNLIADVLASEGITLRVTGGPNIYRSIEWQRFYWDALPYPQAASPGTSSHGGEFHGRDSMAADIDNWRELGKAKFYRYANKHGFATDVISWEPWHIVDFNPWVMPANSGGSTPEQSEEDDMNAPDSMYAEVDGVPSWCWLNWAQGTVYAVHTQHEGDWIQSYMGPVKFNWWGNPMATTFYKNKLALFGAMCKNITIDRSGMTDADFERIQKMLRAELSAPRIEE